ncbi:hypothetical protein AX14_003955 [Amanita brunnescens Koide BX004]|nr:hypothetical protein AX14_003955 [Amanita brunnescens Koide BX004]
MPSKEDPHWREEFVTIRTLVTVFSQRICGCASLVWEAITKEDFQSGQIRKVFMLKQAWQPVNDEAFDGVSKVAINDWELKTYKQAVERLGSNSDNRFGPADRKIGQKCPISSTNICSEDEEPFSYIGLLDVDNNIFHTNNDKIHPRALVRLLMDKCGYPLKYFVDNLELVTALRDAVRDHENMYEKGILHRDISFSNILICDDHKDAGMLIDLDHSKYSAERRAVPSYTDQWEEDE